MSFGRIFRELREGRGLTRAGSEESLGLMAGTVSRWENGWEEPEEELLIELAHRFGLRVPTEET